MPTSAEHIKALELANQHDGEPAAVVARAHEYHAFLAGAAPKPATAAAPKPATAAAPKPATAAAPKAAAPKAAPAAAPKAAPAAAPKPAPVKAVVGDTKDAQGNNTYDDVVAALRRVTTSVPGDQNNKAGQKLAYEILATAGGGVKRVRDLNPPFFDAVVAACDAAVAAAKVQKSPGTGAAITVTSAAVDDFGMPIDTSGANSETAGADDPPEGGSGEDA